MTDTPETPSPHPDKPAEGTPPQDPEPTKRPYGTGTLRQRGPDRWQLRIRVADPEGGPSRQVTRTVVGTRDEAERALARFAVSAEIDDVRQRHSGATLTEVVEGYLERCVDQKRAPMTIYGYRQEWAKVANDLGAWRPDKVGPKKATKYFAKRHRAGMPSATVNAIVRVLRAACNWAVSQEELEKNPFARVELLPTAKTPTRAPSDDQVVAVFTQALEDDLLVAVAVRLAAVMGSRRGELPGQRWNDVDFQGGQVRRHAAVSAPPRQRNAEGKLVGTAQVVVRQTKTKVDEWHPVDSSTMALLKDYRAECEARAAEHGFALADNAFILSNEPDGSRPVRPDAITKRTRYVAERVPGAEGVRPKHLRKWAATVLATEATAAVAQARLDHSDPQTTLRHYVGRNEEAERDAAERLSEHLDSGDAA